MKIEFILIGVIVLVFVIDFLFKKRKRKIDTKDITINHTRKIKAR